jgi:DNA-binding CsgD family transcriptional regulator
MWFGHLTAFLMMEEGRFSAAEATLLSLPESADREALMWRNSLVLALAGLRGEQRAGVQELLGQTCTYDHRLDALEALHDELEAAARLGIGEELLRARSIGTWAAYGDRPPSHHELNEAVLAAFAGRHDEAVTGLRAAVDRDDLHLPAFRRAALQLQLARALVATGRRDEARIAVLAAQDLLARWPGWRRDEADLALARLDAAPAEEDPSGLSPREREVAALLAEGVSNAELARRLYISPKTAAVHVSNILAKLGMSSRAEVAAWAVRTGLAGEPTGA